MISNDADQTGFDNDEYTKGMVCYEAGDADSTPTLNRWEYELVKRFLGRRILEIGAGSGRITSLLISEGNFDELVAAEPSAHFRQLFGSKVPPHPNVRLIAATTRELLPQYNRYFDSVFSAHVMEHVEDDREFLQDQIDLVVPGGRVVALVPALPFLYSELGKKVDHFRRYNKRSVHALVKQLRDCSLRLLSIAMHWASWVLFTSAKYARSTTKARLRIGKLSFAYTITLASI
jgi:SAM-dependent methyltransferase